MIYDIESNIVLIEIERAAVLDISTGDILKAKCIFDAGYTWTEQDTQFVENNPDARLFLKFQKLSENNFKGIGLLVLPEEVY